MENQIVKTIVDQMGGNKFYAMTGAKIYMTTDTSVTFKLQHNNSKANLLTISLTPKDVYIMVFEKFKPGYSKTLKVYEDVYAEMLQELFTEYTGMYTAL